MPRLAEIEAHVASMDTLQGIVGAMRSLAGIRVQEAQRALPGVRRYAEVMASAIGRTLGFIDEPPQRGALRGGRAVIVLTAEHGFSGGFNERLMEMAERVLAPDDRLYVLGSRGAAVLEERGRKPLWSQAMATRSAGARDSALALSDALYRGLAEGTLSRVEVIFSRFRQLGAWEVERKTLLPLDLPVLRSAQPPLHTLPPAALLESLTGDYVFALLVEAVVESIASENSARFAAMESAHDNVGKKLDQLRQDANRVRQDEITTELLDLVTGAEAVVR
ncbi:MAG TPA: FoF1 ATP synthase subunit gamma [Patescibacteria group bacterium]|nr:FoF1 ATP synthase subunit gamma [Patescibacteria group bacterium]